MIKKWLYSMTIALLLFGTTVYAQEMENDETITQENTYGTVVDSGAANEEGTAIWTSYDTTLDGYADLMVITGSGRMTKHGSMSGISKLVIENGISGMKQDLFWTNELTDISIAGSVSSIGDHDFLNSDKLERVTLGEGIKEIGVGSFNGCTKLKTISLPNSLQKIGSDSFAYCGELEEIIIPGNVTSIGSASFYNCSKLSHIVIPSSVTSYELGGIWGNNSQLKTAGPIGSGCNIEYGYTTEIPSQFLMGASYLEHAIIPNGIRKIEEATFLNCEKLQDITIPSSVTTIEYAAFENCSSLSNLTIPNSVTTIGGSAFFNCNSLQRVIIPSSVTYISGNAFGGCDNLEYVSIPASVTEIGDRTFYDCPKLTTAGPRGGGYNIEFEWTTSIQESALNECTYLSSVKIPDTITTIGGSAFAKCERLKQITIPSSVTCIEYRAFQGCSAMENIEVPDSVTRIEWNAFTDCTKLTNIKLPSGLETIEDSLFTNCSSLETVNIPQSVRVIDYNAFENCSRLKTISLPAKLKSIGKEVFKGCTNLEAVTIYPQITSMGENIFAGCIKVKISGYEGSKAREYADKYHIGFVSLGSCCRVVFNTDNFGGYITSSDDSQMYYINNKSYGEFPEITTYSGYMFTGWYTAQTGGKRITENTIVDGTIQTLYAQWIESEIPFKDVPYGVYYYEPVKWAYANGITTGVSATEFGPSKECSRGQIVTFQWRAAGQPTPKQTTCPFTDVAAGTYYYNPVLWAVENKITTGTSATTFSPKGNVSRGQVVTFIWRANGSPEAPASGKFIDVPANAYYAKAVNWCVANGITTGTSANTFSPTKDCVRGQIVTFLYRGYAK